MLAIASAFVIGFGAAKVGNESALILGFDQAATNKISIVSGIASVAKLIFLQISSGIYPSFSKKDLAGRTILNISLDAAFILTMHYFNLVNKTGIIALACIFTGINLLAEIFTFRNQSGLKTQTQPVSGTIDSV